MDNLWLKVENIVAKEEIARFKNSSVAEVSESVYMMERVNRKTQPTAWQPCSWIDQNYLNNRGSKSPKKHYNKLFSNRANTFRQEVFTIYIKDKQPRLGSYCFHSKKTCSTLFSNWTSSFEKILILHSFAPQQTCIYGSHMGYF